MGALADLDLSRVDMLRAFGGELRERAIEVLFSHEHESVRDRLTHLEMLDGLHGRIFCLSVRSCRQVA